MRAFTAAAVLALALAGCEDSGVDISGFPDEVGVETRQFVVALQNAGADVQVVETVPPQSSLFGVPATHLRVNGAEVAVYEFATVAEADAGVARVPFILATTTFPPGPHFYRGNRIIVLYVGQDAAMISLLDRLLGPAFAAGPRSRTGV